VEKKTGSAAGFLILVGLAVRHFLKVTKAKTTSKQNKCKLLLVIGPFPDSMSSVAKLHQQISNQNGHGLDGLEASPTSIP